MIWCLRKEGGAKGTFSEHLLHTDTVLYASTYLIILDLSSSPAGRVSGGAGDPLATFGPLPDPIPGFAAQYKGL